MKNIFTVMNFTMKDMAKRKSFIISTIIILLLIIIGFNIPNIIKSLKGEESSETKQKIILIDNANIFEGNLETLDTSNINYDFEISNYTFEEIKEKINNADIDSAIIIDKQDNNIKMKYIVESISIMTEVPQDLIENINTLYTNMQISKLGLTEEQLQTLVPNFEFDIEQTSDKEVGGNIIVIMLLSIVLFYAIYFCAYQVSTSITTEKTSKIMETLVTSTSPKTIILGKTLGIGIIGLVQLILIVLTAVICANVFLEPGIMDSILDLSNVNAYLAITTIIYFILGYFTYALLYALTGSTVSKPEDVQSANSPVAILAVIGFYLSYFTMMNPTSELNAFASLFPISSPFCMPFRIMMGIATTTEVIISICILIATILIIAKISIKIYSNAMLNYGTKMGFKDIIKMYKDKQN